MQMRTPRSRVARVAVVLAALGLLLGACGSDDDGDDGAAGDDGGTTTTARGQDVNQGDIVIIDNFAFGDGTPVELAAGELLTWQNDDSIRHTVTDVTDDTDDPEFSSDAIQPGDTFSVSFDEPGTFQYHCSIHPDRMRGEVVITEG